MKTKFRLHHADQKKEAIFQFPRAMMLTGSCVQLPLATDSFISDLQPLVPPFIAFLRPLVSALLQGISLQSPLNKSGMSRPSPALGELTKNMDLRFFKECKGNL